jgi:hypothetical protein
VIAGFVSSTAEACAEEASQVAVGSSPIETA